MNLKFLVKLIAISVIIYSCQNTSNKVFIQGQVSGNKTDKVVLNSYELSDTIFLDAKNRFKSIIELNKPSYFNLSVNNSNVQLFLNPGDSVFIKMVKNNIEIGGNNKNTNNYLYYKNEYKTKELGSLIKLFDLKPESFINKTDSVFNSLFLALNKVSIEKKASEFTILEKKALDYEKAQLLLEYASMSPNNYLINKNTYYNFIEQLVRSDSSLLGIPSFNFFVDAYVNWLTSNETIGKGELYAHEYTLIKMQIISRNFASGKIKDQLLYNTLSEHLRFKGYKNTDLLFKTFMFQCNNSTFKEKLHKPYREYLAMNNGKAAPDFKLIDVENNEFYLANLKGKYIYIDVWATWCKPCLEEAPHFEALKEKYSHKNIEFISISVDKKKEKWLKYCELKGKSHNQFWVENTKEFLDAYLIKTIPHFILIGLDGNIIKVNANRPSENNNNWLEELPDKMEV